MAMESVTGWEPSTAVLTMGGGTFFKVGGHKCTT